MVKNGLSDSRLFHCTAREADQFGEKSKGARKGMNLKKLSAALLAVAMVGSLAACGSKSSSSSGSSSGTSKYDADQTLTENLGQEPATMDPSKATDLYGIQIILDTTEPLTRNEQQKDGSNKITPAGAKSWESNTDGSVWTFHLRKNTWNDGQAVTAQDYVYGVQRLMDPKTASQYGYMLSCLKNGDAVNTGKMAVDQLGVKAIDDSTLQFTLQAPTPYFLSLSYTNFILPVRQDIVEKYGDKYGADANTLISCGPFQVKSWTHNSEIILVKNEKYWDKKSVHLTKIDYKIITDETAGYNSFDNGGIDVCGVGDPEWLKRFRAKKGVKYVSYVSPSTNFDFFNTKDKLFSNVNIRKAFTLAENRKDLAKTIFRGMREPAYSWIPAGVDTGKLGDFRKQVNEEPLKQLQKENPDPKALLLKGMQELGLGSDPSKITVTYSTGGTDQWSRNYGEYLQQMFEKSLGVKIELDYNEWATFESKVNQGNYQMAGEAWSIDYNDPMAMLQIMTSTANTIPTGWKNEKFDNLVKQANTEMDESKRVQMYKEAESILLYDDCILCPTVNRVVYRVSYDYVKNMPTNYFAYNSCVDKYTYISGRK